MKRLIPILAIFLLLSSSACSDNEVEQTIPWAQVNIFVKLSGGRDHKLTTPGESLIYTKNNIVGTEKAGFAGVIAIRNYMINNDGSFGMFAYDICCPHERNINTVITPIADGKAKCNQCGSVFNLIDGRGHVVSGPSKNGLQKYQVIPGSSQNADFRIAN